MIKSLEEKAKNYYGGDYQLIGETPSLYQFNGPELISKIEKVFPIDTNFSLRFDFDADNCALFFEGNSARQRVIKGVDFNSEIINFENFNFIEGSAQNLCTSGNNIAISFPIAKQLNVHVGDEITFMLKNINGYINTIPLCVKAIFQDSSLFGMYTSYVNRDCLLSSYGYQTNMYNRLCISLSNSDKNATYFQKELENIIQMYPLVKDKNEFYNNCWTIPMPTYALIPLSANLEDIQILIDAMSLISALIIIILVIIIVAGVSSTFRVIVMKRVNEIGIFKAMGMKRHQIMKMLLTEAFLLLITGCIVGFINSLVLCKIVSLFNLSFIPAFDLFLSNGSLAPVISLGYIFLISGVVCVTTLIGVLFSVRKSVVITPCEALAVTE